MERLNLKYLIEKYKIDEAELGKVLFPTTKYPEYCFRRILKGEAFLDSIQITILANYLSVPVSELFTVEDTEWHGAQEDKRLIFKRGVYKVVVGDNICTLSIWKNDQMIYKSIGDIGLMPVKQFLSEVDSIIKDYK